MRRGSRHRLLPLPRKINLSLGGYFGSPFVSIVYNGRLHIQPGRFPFLFNLEPLPRSVLPVLREASAIRAG